MYLSENVVILSRGLPDAAVLSGLRCFTSYTDVFRSTPTMFIACSGPSIVFNVAPHSKTSRIKKPGTYR